MAKFGDKYLLSDFGRRNINWEMYWKTLCNNMTLTKAFDSTINGTVVWHIPQMGFCYHQPPLSPANQSLSFFKCWLTVTVIKLCVFIVLLVLLSLYFYAVQWLVTVTILYSTVYHLVILWLFFGHFCPVVYVSTMSINTNRNYHIPTRY